MTKDKLRPYQSIKAAAGGLGVPLNALKRLRDNGHAAFKNNGNVDGEAAWRGLLELLAEDGSDPGMWNYITLVCPYEIFHATRLYFDDKKARAVKSRLEKIQRLRCEIAELVDGPEPDFPELDFEDAPEDQLYGFTEKYWGE